MAPKKKPRKIARRMEERSERSMASVHARRFGKGLRRSWKVGMLGRGV
jgi:hypothetical protein